jgi:hypothetical protein
MYDLFASNSPETLRRKLTDARKYLVDHTPNEEERIKWVMIRNQTFIEISYNPDEGVWIRWSDTFRKRLGHTTPEHKTATQEIQERRTVPWKERLLDWLEQPDAGAVFSMTGLALTGDEVQWVEGMCTERMFEYRVNPTMIRIVR